MTNALLIIDVQTALCRGEWAAYQADVMLSRINLLSAAARAVAAPVFLIQHEEDEGPLQYGAPGWQLDAGLQTADSDIRLRKTTPNSFLRTPLEAKLRARGISQLAVCGLQTEFCVDTTVRQALAAGFAVALAADAHSTIDAVLPATQVIAHHNRTLAYMNSYGVGMQVLSAAELANRLFPPAAA